MLNSFWDCLLVYSKVFVTFHVEFPSCMFLYFSITWRVIKHVEQDLSNFDFLFEAFYDELPLRKCATDNFEYQNKFSIRIS